MFCFIFTLCSQLSCPNDRPSYKPKNQHMVYTFTDGAGLSAVFLHVGFVTLTASTSGPHLTVGALVLTFLLANTWE